jgi:hypothetical protein
VLKALQAGELELRQQRLQVQVLQAGEVVAQSESLADEAACQGVLQTLQDLAAE